MKLPTEFLGFSEVKCRRFLYVFLWKWYPIWTWFCFWRTLSWGSLSGCGTLRSCSTDTSSMQDVTTQWKFLQDCATLIISNWSQARTNHRWAPRGIAIHCKWETFGTYCEPIFPDEVENPIASLRRVCVGIFSTKECMGVFGYVHPLFITVIAWVRLILSSSVDRDHFAHARHDGTNLWYGPGLRLQS